MNKKKLIAILTLLCFMFTLMPVAAFADAKSSTPNGNGTADAPYLITTADDLIWFKNQVNTGQTKIHVQLTENIDLSEKTWEPIGNYQNQYRGTFDGNGHTISNLSYTGSSSYEGLFGAVTEGTIKNLNITNASVNTTSGKYGAGIVVGNLTRGTVSNVIVTNGVITKQTSDDLSMCMGGIVGFNAGTIEKCSMAGTVRSDRGANCFIGGIAGRNGTKTVANEVGYITDCTNNAKVSATSGHDYIGGIVGKNTNNDSSQKDSTVKNCTNNGSISTTSGWGGRIGGITGDNDGLIADCMNNGDINSYITDTGIANDQQYGAGGIVGANDGKVERCGNIGNVKGYAHFGGIVGYFNNSKGYIKDCWTTGILVDIPGERRCGGIVGRLQDGNVSNCWSTAQNQYAGTNFYEADAIVGKKDNGYSGIVSNCYYTGTYSTNNSGIEGTAYINIESVQNGKLALLLNGSTRTGEKAVWRQNLDTDKHPTPNKSKPIVYPLCNDMTSGSNDIYNLGHHYDEKGYCENVVNEKVCGLYEPAVVVTNANYNDLGLTTEYIGYYAISNVGQLYWFADATTYHTAKTHFADITLDVNAVLTADIIINEEMPKTIWKDKEQLDWDDAVLNDLQQWKPIGGHHNPYIGTFDGNGYSISGLVSVGALNFDSTKGPASFIYKMAGNSCVCNLTIRDSVYLALEAAGIAGNVDGKNVKIKNCVVDSTIVGIFNNGGIVATVRDGNLEIDDCLFNGETYGAVTGGLLGFYEETLNGKILVTNSVSMGQISELKDYNSYSGGIIAAITDESGSKISFNNVLYLKQNGSTSNVSNNLQGTIHPAGITVIDLSNSIHDKMLIPANTEGKTFEPSKFIVSGTSKPFLNRDGLVFNAYGNDLILEIAPANTANRWIPTLTVDINKSNFSDNENAANSSGGFSGSYNYPVSTPTVDNGSVKLSDNNASAGETVKATVKPDNGYGVAEVIVTDEKGNVIPVTFLGNGEYSFVMPAGKVNIETIIKPAITLTVGDKDANVFGKDVKNDVAPIIVGSRTMLPIRFVAEALGATVDWNEATQTVTIEKDGVKVQIIIGADYAYINGEKVKLDVPAFIENGRTYLPLRFVAEALGADVNWDAVTQQIVIIK